MEQLATRIAEAPFDPDAWPSILKDLATATGAWGGQVFAVADGRFCMDVAGGIPDEVLFELDRRGGADPAVSPRARTLISATPMTLMADAEYVSAVERDRLEIYREFFQHSDVDSYYCTTALLHRGSRSLIGFAVNFGRRQGPADDKRNETLAALLPHLRTAAKLQMRIEDEGARLALGALESLNLSAVICDFAGRVVGATPSAAAELSAGDVVAQRGERLRAVEAASELRLEEAIRRGLSPFTAAGPRSTTVLLRSRDGSRTIAADVSPLPSASSTFRLGARLVVVLSGRSSGGQRLDVILREMGLTAAEADVVRSLLGSASPLEIAAVRGVSVSTVRAQIRSIYGKLGVKRRSELSERLRGLT